MLIPVVRVQAVLLVACFYYWSTSRTTAAPAKAKAKEPAAAGGPSALQAMLRIDF